MRFEEQELPACSSPVSSDELREGRVYFSLTFVDKSMLIPTMGAVVFIGRDLQPGDFGQVYFQDIESYRRGVRFEAATDDDYAQFSMGSENEVGHIFEFERALEELLRCSLRRRKKGEVVIPILRARGLQSEDELPAEPPSTQERRSLRFDDIRLQERFVAALRDAGLTFEVGDDGTVICAADDWPAVNTVAYGIRESCFRWYFSWWKDPVSTQKFWEELKATGLPFQVEYHDGRTIFLLPKKNEDLHEVVSGRVQMKIDAGST